LLLLFADIANVLLSEVSFSASGTEHHQRTYKVCDFGLSRVIEGGEGALSSGADSPRERSMTGGIGTVKNTNVLLCSYCPLHLNVFNTVRLYVTGVDRE
jgi:hypothetical protein